MCERFITSSSVAGCRGSSKGVPAGREVAEEEATSTAMGINPTSELQLQQVDGNNLMAPASYLTGCTEAEDGNNPMALADCREAAFCLLGCKAPGS